MFRVPGCKVAIDLVAGIFKASIANICVADREKASGKDLPLEEAEKLDQ